MPNCSPCREPGTRLLLPRVETGNPYVSYEHAGGGFCERRNPAASSPRTSLPPTRAPDGASLAAIRIDGSKQRVEYPWRRDCSQSPSRAFLIRVSPAGDRVAFFELDASGLWSVVLVNRSGRRQNPLRKKWPTGGAWPGRPTAARNLVCRRTRRRRVEPLRGQSGRQAQDPALRSGHARAPRHDRCFRPHSSRRCRWRTASSAAGKGILRSAISPGWRSTQRFSSDGRRVLLRASRPSGIPAGPPSFSAPSTGRCPVRLGYGIPQELSGTGTGRSPPEGAWSSRCPRRPAKGAIETAFPMITAARWLPDDDRVLVLASDAQGRSVASVMSFSGGLAQPVSNRSSCDSPAGAIGCFRQCLPTAASWRPRSPAARYFSCRSMVGHRRPCPGPAGTDVDPMDAGWTRPPAVQPGHVADQDVFGNRSRERRARWFANSCRLTASESAGVVQRRSLQTGQRGYGYQRYHFDLYRVTGLR